MIPALHVARLVSHADQPQLNSAVEGARRRGRYVTPADSGGTAVAPLSIAEIYPDGVASVRLVNQTAYLQSAAAGGGRPWCSTDEVAEAVNMHRA